MELMSQDGVSPRLLIIGFPPPPPEDIWEKKCTVPRSILVPLNVSPVITTNSTSIIA